MKPDEHWRPDLLVIGHITRDEIAGDTRLGGAASFAARAGSLLGLNVGLVTAAPEDHPLLAPLHSDPRIEIAVARSEVITTFELDYSGPARVVHLRARAPTLEPGDIPVAWRKTPVTYLAPVIAECGRACAAALTGSHLVVGAQGWLRSANGAGLIRPALLAEIERPPAELAALILSEADHPEAYRLATTLARTIPHVIVTRGAAGSRLLTEQREIEIAPVPAQELDPTGAGDVFGVVFAVATQRGLDAEQAAMLASHAAAHVVKGPELGRIDRFIDSDAWHRFRRRYPAERQRAH